MLCTAGQQAAYARRVRSSFKPWNLRLHKATSADNTCRIIKRVNKVQTQSTRLKPYAAYCTEVLNLNTTTLASSLSPSAFA